MIAYIKQQPHRLPSFLVFALLCKLAPILLNWDIPISACGSLLGLHHSNPPNFCHKTKLNRSCRSLVPTHHRLWYIDRDGLSAHAREHLHKQCHVHKDLNQRMGHEMIPKP